MLRRFYVVAEVVESGSSDLRVKSAGLELHPLASRHALAERAVVEANSSASGEERWVRGAIVRGLTSGAFDVAIIEDGESGVPVRFPGCKVREPFAEEDEAIRVRSGVVRFSSREMELCQPKPVVLGVPYKVCATELDASGLEQREYQDPLVPSTWWPSSRPLVFQEADFLQVERQALKDANDANAAFKNDDVRFPFLMRIEERRLWRGLFPITRGVEEERLMILVLGF